MIFLKFLDTNFICARPLLTYFSMNLLEHLLSPDLNYSDIFLYISTSLSDPYKQYSSFDRFFGV